MSHQFDYCTGCDDNGSVVVIKEDHRHQFINTFGDAVTVYWIDGVCCTNIDDAIDRIVELYELDNRRDAHEYLRSIKKVYR